MPSSATQADTVIRNANIITIDRRNPKAQALAIRDGKFMAVGSNSSIGDLVGTGTQVLDMSGRTVLPGFIDAHIHVLSSGIRHVMSADCRSAHHTRHPGPRCGSGQTQRPLASGCRASSSTTPR